MERINHRESKDQKLDENEGKTQGKEANLNKILPLNLHNKEKRKIVKEKETLNQYR